MVMILSFAACGKEKVEEPKYDASAKSEGVMSYAQYIASEEGSEVTIEAYVQAKQSWWNDSISVFLQDPDGGYFVYNMACSKEDAENLVQGTKWRQLILSPQRYPKPMTSRKTSMAMSVVPSEEPRTSTGDSSHFQKGMPPSV